MSVLAIVGVTAAIGSWTAAPFVSMARRGTVDQQTRDAWREEGLRAEAVRRARRREALVATIPAPRSGAHDQQRSPVSA